MICQRSLHCGTLTWVASFLSHSLCSGFVLSQAWKYHLRAARPSPAQEQTKLGPSQASHLASGVFSTSGDGDLFFLIPQAGSSGSSLDASLLLPLWTQSSPLYQWHMSRLSGHLASLHCCPGAEPLYHAWVTMVIFYLSCVLCFMLGTAFVPRPPDPYLYSPLSPFDCSSSVSHTGLLAVP